VEDETSSEIIAEQGQELTTKYLVTHTLKQKPKAKTEQ
jgi:hypothetical protein